MYKDPDKQREANRQASKKYRDSMTGKGMTVAREVIPKTDIHVIPEGVTVKGVTGIDKALLIGRDEDKQESELCERVAKSGILHPVRTAKGNIRVSKPSDGDYNGVCTDEWRAEQGR